MATRRLYNQRVGAESPRLSLSQARKLVASAFDMLDRESYFDKTFGRDCVDDGHMPGDAGPDVKAFVFTRTRLENALPLKPAIERADEVALFTLIEFVFDCVAKPISGDPHPYSDCGTHFKVFDVPAGRVRWREEVNDVLGDYGEGFQLSPDGEVCRVGQPGVRELLAAKIPVSAGESNRAKIEDAIRRYQHGRSTKKQRRDAVRDLADVLEYLRPKVKTHLLSKDEDDLFNIANRFAIRHHSQVQKDDYDTVWLSWMFYLYLSTIHLVLRLIERGGAAK